MTIKPPKDLPTAAQMDSALRFLVRWVAQCHREKSGTIGQHRLAQMVGTSQIAVHKIQAAWNDNKEIRPMFASTFIGLARAYEVTMREQRLAKLKERSNPDQPRKRKRTRPNVKTTKRRPSRHAS